MMKGFLKKGKWLGLIMVALLFAGCYGGGGSEDGAVDSGSQASLVGVPITMDPMNKTISVGDGGLGAGTGVTADGHDIQIINGSTSLPTCTGAGADVQCWLRLVNRDPDMYMANAYLLGTQCTGCLTAQIDNADMVNGDTTAICTGSNAQDGCGTTENIDGLGICIVEDGQFKTQGTPHNEKGCPIHETTNSAWKPVQVLHPDCGTIGILLDFGVQVEQYNFSGTVVAEWYPWTDPTGDARFDNLQHSTYYVMVTDLNDKGGATANEIAWFIPGSYKRSNVLSGWSSAGDANLAEGQYFAVNVAAEYADRIEAQVMGNNMVNQTYEYYLDYGYILRYNPSIVTELALASLTTPGATVIYRGARYHCADDAANNIPCSSGKQGHTGLGAIAYGTNDYRSAAAGWVALSIDLAANFSYFAYGATYQTLGGGVINLKGASPNTPTGNWGTSNYLIIPKAAGHYGVANINNAVGTVNYAMSNGMVQQGADAAPDMPLTVYYFRVNNTINSAGSVPTSGLGSEFWIDTMSTATHFAIAYTAAMMYPSGNKMSVPGSDDELNICVPRQAGQPQGCDVGIPQANYDVYSGQENVNLQIGHSGMAAWGGDAGGGAMQQWPAHICVQ